MVRWEPGAKERLQAAALELYVDRGLEQTTAADVAAAAGLTERTFFRYFADKREVLFDGQEVLERAFTDGVATAPADAAPLATVASALAGAAGFFSDERREHSRRRQSVIDAHAALRERELLKLASLAGTVAEALRRRGVDEPAATLAAEAGLAVFKVAFAQWIADGETRSMDDITGALTAELASMGAGLRAADAAGPAPAR